MNREGKDTAGGKDATRPMGEEHEKSGDPVGAEGQPGLYADFLELRKAIRRHRKELSAETEERVSFEQALLHWARGAHGRWLEGKRG